MPEDCLLKVLALSAHADDAHLAAGGALIRLMEEGHEVYYVAFSIAEESVPKGFAPDILDSECRSACAEMAIPPGSVIIKRYKVRLFPDSRQKILDELIVLRKEIDPQVVFMPSTMDIHQDHGVMAAEAVRAFKRTSTLYGFDMPWNFMHTTPLNVFFELSPKHLEKKVAVLQHYKSQLGKENDIASPEYVRSLAVERGNRIGVKYAEAFEAVREVKRIAR